MSSTGDVKAQTLQFQRELTQAAKEVAKLASQLAASQANLHVAELALTHVIIQGHAESCWWATHGCSCHLKIAAIALDLVPEVDREQPVRERIEAALAARRR